MSGGKGMKKGKQLLAMALSAALTISGLPAVVLAEGQTSEMTGGGINVHMNKR